MPEPISASCAAKLSQLLTAAAVLFFNATGSELGFARPLFQLTLVLTVASAVHYTYLVSTGPPTPADAE